MGANIVKWGNSLKPLAAQGFRSHTGVLAAEGKIVRYHGDEFTICGLALDAADGVAEELLQHLYVASVPGYLNGVADFQGFALKENDLFLRAFFIIFSKKYIGLFIGLNIINLLLCSNDTRSKRTNQQPQTYEHRIIFIFSHLRTSWNILTHLLKLFEHLLRTIHHPRDKKRK